jgi:anti-anti-sigma factor
LAVLDLSQVTFLSSLGMGLLVRLSRDLGRWNGRVKIANCPPAIREALEVARLMDFFQFHATVDEALSSVQAPEARLDFEIEDLGSSVVVVRVRGQAGCDHAVDLNEQLKLSMKPGTQFIILDLAELHFVGPEALQILAEFGRDVGQQGGEVWLAGLQPAVWLALHNACLERLFTIRASLAEALSS